MGQSTGFEFACPTPGCGHVYRATPQLAGKTILCKTCQQKVKVPAEPADSIPAPASVGPSAASTARGRSLGGSGTGSSRGGPPSSPPPRKPATQPAPPRPPDDTEQVECPSCLSLCRVRREWRGSTLRCPSCQQQFVVPHEMTDAVAAQSAATDDTVFNTVDDYESASGPPASFLTEFDDGAAVAEYSAVEESAPALSLALAPAPRPRKRSARKGDIPNWVKVVAAFVLVAVLGGAAYVVIDQMNRGGLGDLSKSSGKPNNSLSAGPKSSPNSAAPVAPVASSAAPSEHERIIKDLISLLEEMLGVFRTVTDRSSAMVADVRLRSIVTRGEDLGRRLDRMPAPSAAEDDRLAKLYRQQVESLVQQLEGEVNRIQALSVRERFKNPFEDLPSVPRFGGGFGPPGGMPNRQPGASPGAGGFPGGPPGGFPSGPPGGFPSGPPGGFPTGPPAGVPRGPGGFGPRR